MKSISFKDFLLTEEKGYFGARVGDVLNAVQDLNNDADAMGNRHLSRLVVGIVNQIRQILHSNWSISQRPMLLRLQKIGVALMKSIDEKGDVKEVLDSVSGELASIMQKLGVPTNNLGEEEGADSDH